MPKITEIKIKQTQKGDEYKCLTTDSGEQANVFQFHSMYADLAVGGEIKLEKDGKYWNVADPLKDETKTTNRKSGMITQAQDRKERSISHSQDVKEMAIKTSSTARDATLILTASGIDTLSEIEIKTKWKKWREWLYVNWDLPNYPTEINEPPEV